MMDADPNKCPDCGSDVIIEDDAIFCPSCEYFEDLEEGWTDDQEEDLIRAGICPECGAELDVCPHGADWFDDPDYDDYAEEEVTMFLVIYEDHRKDPQNIATAATMTAAKACIDNHFGEYIKNSDYQVDDKGRTICILGDTQYAIESLVHWS